MKKTSEKLILYIIVSVVTLFYLLPMLVLLTTSFKPESQILSRTWEWIPRTITLENYQLVLRNYPFLKWVLNSAVITFGAVVITLLTALPAGFAFAKLHFRGKNFLFTMVLLTIMVPFFAYTPQLYLLIDKLGMKNTYLGIILPLTTSGVSVFLFRQFILQLPDELIEAASLDGCSRYQIFRSIILPLSKPAITTSIIFTSIKTWNNLLWPLIASSDEATKPLTVGLALNVFGVTTGFMHQPPFGLMMAASLLSIIIPVGIFILLQKYFVQGIATTGLK